MQELTMEAWPKLADAPKRRQWAREHPLAWILEYRPTILLPGKGQVAFDPWPFQRDFLSTRDRLRAINKPRQCGISTTAAAEVAWEFDNVPGAQIVIISKDKDAAVNFHKYVYNVLYSVRKNNHKAPRLIKTNERETTNSNGSRIMSLAASKETGRSFSATHLVFDEMAAATYADDIWQAASPALSQTRGRLTAISTPKGRANLFAKIFESRGNLGFTTFSYAWWDVPTYNPYYDQYAAATSKHEKNKWIAKARTGEWYRTMRPQYSDLVWRQEFEGAFDANQGTVFSTRSMEKTFWRNTWLEEKEDEHGILTEWFTSPRKTEGMYSVGIDLGRKNDPSVIITYDFNTKPARMVDYKYIEAGRCDWSQIAKIVKEHLEYWDPQVATHDGVGVGDSISESMYGLSEPFMFTSSAKQTMIERMQHAFDFGAVRAPKIPTLYDEHRKYIWDDKDIEQDTVMANGLAIMNFHDTEDSVVGFVPDVNFIGVS